MAVKIITAEGLEYIFNPSFRVMGLPLTRDIPSLSIGGRDGEVVHADATRLTPRTVSVVGHIYGSSSADADAALDEMLAVISKGELRLYRDESDSKFLKVRFAGNAHSYISGTNRVVASCNLSFTAHDPYFYEPLVKTEESILSSDYNWSVYRGGNVEWLQPIIAIHAITGYIVAPKLESDTESAGGLLWPDVIPESMSLIINCEKRLAFITDAHLDYYLWKWGMGNYDCAPPAFEEQVTASMATSWLINGWPLHAGRNNLTYTDDVASSHMAEITIAHIPKYY